MTRDEEEFARMDRQAEKNRKEYGDFRADFLEIPSEEDWEAREKFYIDRGELHKLDKNYWDYFN